MKDKAPPLQSLSEIPNAATAAILEKSKIEIESGDYHSFANNKDALNFLARELQVVHIESAKGISYETLCDFCQR